MKQFKNIYIIFICSLLISSCQGLTIDEIRRTKPVDEYISAKNINVVLSCIADSDVFNDLFDRLKIVTFPDGKKVEIKIGAVQMGEFKHFYLITLMSLDADTKITVIRQDSNPLDSGNRKIQSTIYNCSN
jgi:hypothetical protein